MAMPTFADPANLMVEEREEGPEGETSLELLQNVYRNRKQPLNVRVRCAVEALVHEYPKLSAVAHKHFDFASELDKAILERAIARSNAPLPPPKQIEAKVEQISAETMKRPFSRLSYRRF